MNKDQVKGKAKEIAGEIQEQTGRVIGSEEQEAKGHAREVEGKIQQKVGDVKEAVEDTKDEIKRDLKR
ncbi:MAG: CsbD family protein [Burkholderiaceae bacterium]|nr:CsbD family protein [Burkholderiaceae bacterium]